MHLLQGFVVMLKIRQSVCAFGTLKKDNYFILFCQGFQFFHKKKYENVHPTCTYLVLRLGLTL